MYKSGTTRGLGHGTWDACVGTWDLGTRDEGLEDIKYGTRGRVGRGRGKVIALEINLRNRASLIVLSLHRVWIYINTRLKAR